LGALRTKYDNSLITNKIASPGTNTTDTTAPAGFTATDMEHLFQLMEGIFTLVQSEQASQLNYAAQNSYIVIQ
jgi:hypothetical protein